MSEKSLRLKVEALKLKKLAASKVVKLEDFRKVRDNSMQPTVLVVDDDEVMRNGLKRILESEGYKVILAEDGLELSKVLENVKMDLILLDVNLPWVDGLELCSLIKEHPELSKVPLLLVSARKSQTDIEAGFKSGCNEYITKPFDVDHIITVIQRYFQDPAANQK